MIKKKICMFFMAVICFILQSTVLKALELGAVSPNLLLIITASFGFIGGRRDGMLWGYFVDCLRMYFMDNCLAIIFYYIH